MNALPPRDHNGPPAFDPDVLAALRTKVERAAETAGAWLDARVIESDEDASRANDYVRALKALRDEIDGARKEAKRPHDEAAKAVQVAFAALLDPLAFTDGAVKKMLSDFAARKRSAAEEAKAAEIARLEEEHGRATAALQAAHARNDVIGIAAETNGIGAIEDRLEALRGKRVKVQIASATGGGRTMAERTTRRARVVNLNLAFMHFRDRPEIAAALESLANAELRASRGAALTLPGFEIITERTVA